MRRRLLVLLATFSWAFACEVQAHHSFAIYDINNRIERTGVLTSFVFANPHIRLVLEVEQRMARPRHGRSKA